MGIIFAIIFFTIFMNAARADAAEKPRIAVLATGGTIAGVAESPSTVTGYKAGEMGIDALLAAAPGIENIADVTGEEICNIDSKDMTDAIWLKLAKRVNELLAGDADGVVITHGTDTLEETAYFLHLTVKSDKPVALTGAMRPATAVSADGPMNLLSAVRVAACHEAAGKGVLVVMNDEIHGARDVAKTNTMTVSAFKSPGSGSLGHMSVGVPEFYRTSTRLHTVNSEFNIAERSELHYVKIVYGHAGDDGVLIEAAAKAGAKGIVYAGMGNGSIHAEAEKALRKASEDGIIVVRSSRTGSGAVAGGNPSYAESRFIDGDTLSPQKARVLLSLALTKTSDPGEIRRIFKTY